MYAIVEAKGKQFKVQKDDTFIIDRISGKKNHIVKFKHVLFAKEKNSFHVGEPYLKDAYVSCEIIDHPRAKKVVAFKYKRRKSQKVKIGHRQDQTKLKVTEIHV